jgi:dTDP-4-amino-4,6-dideoxygalactose transaminase
MNRTNSISYENLRLLNQPFHDEYMETLDRVLKSGWFILGKEVEQFENEFASYCQLPYCAGVANGLDALALSLRAFNFSDGKEVIVPANTYIATIIAIINEGFKPVLVEPDIHTYNIDPLRIEEKINKNTVAIMVVHLYGKCCEMNPILELVNKYNLKLIEDCAQSHGAKYKGKISGSFGHFGAFSFYPTKNLGALGDAGAVVCKEEEDWIDIKRLRNYGSRVKYYNEVVGFNSRLDEVQAAFLRIKLKSLDKINEHKRTLAQVYFDRLTNEVIKPEQHKDYFDVYHIYNIRTNRRDELKKYLAENGVITEIHYPVPPHRQQAMKGYIDEGDYSISEEIHHTTLSLPISYFHALDDVERVCEAVNSFFK